MKNSTSETAGSSLSTRIAVATSLPRSGYPTVRSSENPASRRRAAVFALALPDHGDLVAAGREPDAEGVLDGAEIFVGDSEESGQPGLGQGQRAWLGSGMVVAPSGGKRYHGGGRRRRPPAPSAR